jgi:hypothetical protein
MTNKADLPSLAEVRDILDHVRGFAQMAAKSLDAGQAPNAHSAISAGTNAIIAELDTADEILDKVHVGEP